MGFPHVQHVLDGSNIVALLTDDNFEELVPPRIAYLPGTVLEVVALNTHCDHNPDIQSPVGTPLLPHAVTLALTPPSFTVDEEDISTLSLDTLAQNLDAGESILNSEGILGADLLDIEQFDSAELTERSKATLLQVCQLNDSYLNAIKSGQVSQATDIKNTMKGLFDNVLSELDKSNSFQDKLLQLQELMLVKQQQALEAHVITQKNIQAVFTQSYELHEFPIPRLFIVLPHVSTTTERVTKLFSHQFRLFFLCECGTHTMEREGGQTPRVHLADHEGYSLEKPTEFFEKYGSYLLTMMQMVKYGVSAAGVVVPSFVTGPLNPLVDQSIAFLSSQKELTDASKDLASYGMSDQHVILEGADLRKLSSYLKITDKDNVLGNLYRMVTPEGHVKWVCSKHYRQGYREAGTETLQDVVKVNRGHFEQAASGDEKIKIKLDSPIQAQQFYRALAKATVVEELDVTLCWDASMADLKTFVNAVSKTTLHKLTMNGLSFKNPTLDIVNRGRRFEPLLQLLFNDHIQSLHFKDFDDFFFRVGDPQAVMAPNLRSLSFTTGPVTKGKNSCEVLAKIMKGASSLTELRLSSRILFDFALRQVSNSLKTLAWDGNGFSAEAHLRVGSITAMKLKIDKLECLSQDCQMFTTNGQISEVRVDQTPLKSDEAMLRRMIQKNHDLSTVIISSDLSRAVPLLNLLVSTRDEIFSTKESCNLIAITVQDIDRERDFYKTTVKYTSGTTKERSILSGLNMRDSSNVDTNALADYLQQFGNTMHYLVTSNAFADRHAESLRNASSPHLVALNLSPSLLRDTSLDAISRYIEKSPKLQKLAFTFELVWNERQREVSARLLSRHRRQVTSIRFIGELHNPWLSQLIPALPPKSEFTRLEDLNILLGDVSTNDSHWISSMVSAQHLALDAGQTGVRRECAPLIKFCLGGFPMRRSDWATVIKSLDFTTLQQLSFPEILKLEHQPPASIPKPD
ncbi:hypothetical protein EC991_009097 [Linnemannia zychae]|nr:hypothetical protein EC991_009097 [Linnemannia zychae]